jgi:hypothetical protein
MNINRKISIGDLYPQLNQEQQDRAATNIRRYVQIIVGIHARLRAEGKHWPTPEESRDIYGFPGDLTSSHEDASVSTKVEAKQIKTN